MKHSVMGSLLVLVILIQAWAVKPQADKNIFILAGQSNMAGRGGVVNDTVTTTWDGVVPPQCNSNPSILRLNAQLQWVEAKEPLHQDIDAKKTNGIGPAMAFANSFLDKREEFGVVGLVPCAIGGTNISEWEQGKVLYNQMMRRVKASLNDGGSIRALLWYQGESDTVNLNDAQSYQRKIHKFFMDVRNDLQSPLLPIVQFEIPEGGIVFSVVQEMHELSASDYRQVFVALASGEGPYKDIVREAQLGIDLPNLRTVDALGFPLEPIGLHLTTPAQVNLGQMMADSFLQFVPSSNPQQLVSPTRNHNEAPTRPYNCVSDNYIFPLFIRFVTIIFIIFLCYPFFFIIMFAPVHKQNHEIRLQI